MGLFDSLEAVLKSEFGQLAESEAGVLLPAALQAAGLGSLQNVVDQLQQAGFGHHVQSWASGNAQPISADELKTILDIDQVKQLAQHFGVDPNAALDLLAKFLPGAISASAQSGGVTTN